MPVHSHEDSALDLELERLARTEAPPISDNVAVPMVKKAFDDKTMLGEFVENYKPAETLLDLDEQVLMCAEYGADSIQISPQIMRKFAGPRYTGPYLLYKDVKCYLAEGYEEKKDLDKLDLLHNPSGRK